MTASEDRITSFLEQGYLHIPGLLPADYLEMIRTEFDRVWDLEAPRVTQSRLLKYRTFIDLVAYPPLLAVLRALFGTQLQLLQADLLRQGPRSSAAERAWHRDFSFRGDYPLTVNSIIYLDDMTEERGPTRVVPGSHRGTAVPPPDHSNTPLPREVAIYAAAGDAVLINGSIWHTGGRNSTDGLRRGIYLYYGYWWLRRFEPIEPQHAVPWQALAGADNHRLELLGVKLPGASLHMYEPE